MRILLFCLVLVGCVPTYQEPMRIVYPPTASGRLPEIQTYNSRGDLPRYGDRFFRIVALNGTEMFLEIALAGGETQVLEPAGRAVFPFRKSFKERWINLLVTGIEPDKDFDLTREQAAQIDVRNRMVLRGNLMKEFRIPREDEWGENEEVWRIDYMPELYKRRR